MNSEEGEIAVNLIIIGDASVGKSSLINQYINESFDEEVKPTIGVDFYVKQVKFNDKIVSVKIWDTAGQEKYRAVGTKIFKTANGILLTYDVTNPDSYENLNKWLAEIKENCSTNFENLVLMLIGNKADLINQKQVSSVNGKRFAEIYKAFFFETSAKSSENVKEAFDILIEETAKNVICRQTHLEKLDQKLVEKSIIKIQIDKNDQKSGCC
jgi:small GTP-binding protein